MINTLKQIPIYALVCSFCLSLLSGLLLSINYIPTIERAALSILHIQSNTFAGTSVVSIHHVSSLFAVVLLILNIIVTLIHKTKSACFQSLWASGILSISFLFVSVVSGYLLQGNRFTIGFLQLFSSDTVQIPLPPLFDTGSIGLIRVYILHIIILPLFLSWLIYTQFVKTKKLFDFKDPFAIPVIVIFVSTIIIELFSIRVLKIQPNTIMEYSPDNISPVFVFISNISTSGAFFMYAFGLIVITALLLLAGYFFNKGKK